MLCLLYSYCWLEVSLREVSLSIPTRPPLIHYVAQAGLSLPGAGITELNHHDHIKFFLKIVLNNTWFFFQLSESDVVIQTLDNI